MSDVFFARAVLVQEVEGKCVRYSTDNESAIIVTKSEDLNIVMPASENGPSIYLDIPLNEISHVAVATLDEPSQLSPTVEQTVVALSIQMSSISESSCYLNATRCHTTSVEVAFDNLDAATRVKSSLLANKYSAHKEPQLSHSVIPIDVSQVEDDKTDDFVLPDDNLQALRQLRAAAPKLDDLFPQLQQEDTSVSQAVDWIDVSRMRAVETNTSMIPTGDQESSEDLVGTATKAHALVLKRTSLEEPLQTRSGVTNSQQLLPSGTGKAQEVKPNGSSPAVHGQIVSASPGIPVNPEATLEETENEVARNLEYYSRTDLRDSEQWQKGRQLIDIASGFKAMPPKLSTQRIGKEHDLAQKDVNLSKQDSDHASLYDRGPRSSPIEPKPAKSTVEQSSTRAQWQHPVKPPGESNASASRSGESSHKKLTQRMRNDEGEATVESSSIAHPLKSLNLPRKEEISKAQTGEISHRRTLKSGNGHQKGQQQSKRQGKQQGRASKITKDTAHTNGTIDEFEMPVSPSQSRKHKAVQQAVAEAPLTQRKAKRRGIQSMHKVAFSAEVLPDPSYPSTARRTQAQNKPGANPTAASNGTRHKSQTKPKASGVEIVDWDEDLEVNDEESRNISPKVKRKTVKRKPLSPRKGQKSTSPKPNSVKKCDTNGNASPVSLNKPRTRRAAALKANKKIQGIAESNVSEKENQPDTQPLKRKDKSGSVRKERPSFMPPTSHMKLGDAGQKAASFNTPSTSWNVPFNRVNLMLDTQRMEEKSPAPQAAPMTGPSNEIILVNATEQNKGAVPVEQSTLQHENLGTIGTMPEDDAVATDSALAPALDGDVKAGDLSVLDIEDSHFQDAMTFSASNASGGSKSPIHGDKRPKPATASTREECQVLGLNMENSPNQNSPSTNQMVELSAPKDGVSWAGKLKGALLTVPMFSPKRTKKVGRETEPQNKPESTPKLIASKTSSQAIKSEKSPIAIARISSPHHLDGEQRAGEPSHQVVEAGQVNLGTAKGHSQESTEDGSQVVYVPHANSAVEPASKAPTAQLSEVIEISSQVEASSDESVMDDSNLEFDAKFDPAPETAHDAQVLAVTPPSVDNRFRKVPANEMEEVTIPRSTAKSRSEKRREEVLNMETRSGKTMMNALPITVSGGNAPLKHTPDPNRKSNLISFSAGGPRNQGVAPDQKHSAFGSTVRQDSPLPLFKKPNIHKLRNKNRALGEAPPRKSTPNDTRIMVPTGGRQAPEIAPSHGMRCVSKLKSKLQNSMATTKPYEMPNISFTKEVYPTGKGVGDDDDVTAESLTVARVQNPPFVPAKPVVAVADMGYNAGRAKSQENEVVRRALHAVPVRLPSTEIVCRASKRSLSQSRIIDATPRETKRHAEDNAVDILNEVALGKRRKLSPKVIIADQIPARLILKRNSSLERDLLHIKSSQSSRVDENGSPLPFTHSRYIDIGEFQPRLTQDIVRLPLTARHVQGEQERITRTISEVKIGNNTAPLCKDPRAPKPRRIHFEASSNSKLQPSSPNAPSSIVDEMEAHHIDDMGKFVNVETEHVITPHAPPDPFLGTSQKRPNKFMDALRRSSDGVYKIKTHNSRAVDAQKQQAQGIVTYEEVENEDEEGDMEKTLIELDSQGKDFDTTSESSFRTSQPEDRSSPEKHPGRDSRSTVKDEWRRTLQPHQRQILDVLYDISHVSPFFPLNFILHRTKANSSISFAISSPRRPQFKTSSTTIGVRVNVY